ncbi:MAG TPA: Crp/Fnr family transcriptional regulator [Cyclobacteriaceae bacterium]|nr:Crp/Fnr family transcriptional regulator [Cyclobacteriaceae bacterium]HRJ82663.1 Crp/Fnr family transcriptional regulator [Cyclobacteriaceae bacterium]
MNPISSILNQLHPLTAETAEGLDLIQKRKFFRKGDMLVRVGQVPQHFYFVVKGLARVYYNRKGKDITDYFAIDNQFIGALPALFTQQPSHKAIEVLEDSDVIYFSYSAFDKLCEQHYDLERAARKMAIIGMLEGQHRIESIRFLSAKERYEELEKLYPGITNRAPLKHIASYLGITQVSISRIRAGKQ